MSYERFPLREPERRLTHAIGHAIPFMAHWTARTEEQWNALSQQYPGEPERERNMRLQLGKIISERDEYLAQLEFVQHRITNGTYAFTEAGDWRRAHIGFTLQECRDRLQDLLQQYQASLVRHPRRSPKVSEGSYDDMFTRVIMSHVLVGRAKNPNEEEDTALVYAQENINGVISYRTFNSTVSLAKVAVFDTRHKRHIVDAARKRRNEVFALRQACLEGTFAAAEIELMRQDIFACRTAMDVVARLGNIGDGTTQQQVTAYKAARQARVATVQVKLGHWRNAYGMDHRFSDLAISRAADHLVKNLAHVQANLTGANAVAKYIWDYCWKMGDTKTWQPTFKLHRPAPPIAYAMNWRAAKHNGPLRGLPNDPVNQFVQADLDGLRALSHIASEKMDKQTAAPQDATEETAKIFNRDFVVAAAFDLENPPDKVYFGKPIRTKNYETLLARLIPNGERPAMPNTYSLAPPRRYGADAGFRALVFEQCEVFYDTIKGGGLKAFHAITQLAMERFFNEMVSDNVDAGELDRIAGLLNECLDEDNADLQVTAENSNLSQAEIDVILREQRKNDRPEGEQGSIDLPPRQMHLPPVVW